jgi:hypothetical protein
MPDVLPIIAVNFSHLDDDGLVFAGVEDSDAELAEGMDVLATDDEGHECLARVARIAGPLVYLALDRDTWTVSDTRSLMFLVSPMVSGNGHGNGAAVTDSEGTVGRVVSPA